MPVHPSVLLEEFAALTKKQNAGGLSAQDAQRLELLRDVLLELGALPVHGEPTRALRAAAVLEVSFATQDEAIRAYSKNIGAGGIAIATTRALPVGSVVTLHIKLPDQPQLAVVEGKVAWSRPDSMGVAFEKVRPDDEVRLKELLIKDEGVLKRVRAVLNTDVRQIAAKGREVLTTDVREIAAKGREVLTTDLRELGASKPKPAVASEVDTRRYVQILLADGSLAAVLAEVLSLAGYRAIVGAVSATPAVIIVDTTTATAAATVPAKLVLINVSGPDALTGKLMSLKPAAFVRRPATAAAIAQTVGTLISPGS